MSRAAMLPLPMSRREARAPIGIARGFAIAPGADYQTGISGCRDSSRMAGGLLATNLLAHRAALLRYLRARGAGDDAEDLLQELWLKIEAADAATVGDELAYLYRMAHNLMIDRHRGAMRRRKRENEFQDGIAWSETPSVERTLIARDELGQVERTLRGLGERTDHIFRRHRIENVAQRDIAAELGISLSAVEKHLQKAYRAMGAWAARHRAGGMTEEIAHDRR